MEGLVTSASGLMKFDPSDTSTVSNRWKKWKRGFEIFLDVNNVTIPARKRSYLLHYAGCDVQDIFFNLRGDEEVPIPEGSDLYKESMKVLDNYFLPLKCLPRERHIFRNLEQKPDESIEKFVLRLREQGSLCDYGDWLEQNIKEQIFEKGYSDELRAKILTQPDMTLSQTVELARSLETIEKHRNGHKVELLNRVSKTKGECFRCGYSGHYANDDECPARNKKCEKCHLLGHFKRCCKTKGARGHKDCKSRRKKKLHQVSDGDTDGETDDSSGDDCSSTEEEKDVNYVFALSPDGGEKVVCQVGGVKLNWLVDSGTSVNVISQSTWEYLKSRKVNVQYQTGNVKNKLVAYGNHQLNVVGMFVAHITTVITDVSDKIFVVKEPGFNLLGRKTATELGMLQINATIWAAEPEWEKISKQKGVKTSLQVDPAKFIQHTKTQIPIALQTKLTENERSLFGEDVLLSETELNAEFHHHSEEKERSTQYGYQQHRNSEAYQSFMEQDKESQQLSSTALEKLKEYGTRTIERKCEFQQSEIGCVEHQWRDKGDKPAERKVEELRLCRRSESTEGIKSLLKKISGLKQSGGNDPVDTVNGRDFGTASAVFRC